MDRTETRLRPEEVELIGSWQLSAGTMIADDTCRRIAHLIEGQLVRIAVDPTGWKALYCDPQDSGLWELSYPQSELHNGGPPRLQCISIQQAEASYNVAV